MSNLAAVRQPPVTIDVSAIRAYLQQHQAPVAGVSKVASIVVYLWVLLLTSSDIKNVTTLYVHWWAAVPVIVLLFPTMLRTKWRIDFSILFSGLFFTAAVLFSGWEDPTYAAQQAGKLALICIGSFLVFQQFPGLARVGFAAIRHSVYLNTALLATMAMFPGVAAWQMAPGRWGTVLNMPGSLWRIGILTLVYGAYLLYVERPFSIRGCLLFACSCILIYADGSRTAMFLIPVSVVYLAVVLLRETRTHMDTLRLALLIMLSVFAAGFFVDARSRMFGTYSDSADALTRIAQFSDEFSTDGYGLAYSDPVRYEMVRYTLEQIKEQPFFGRGIGTTRINTPAGPMVVHMTYLQLWADLGIFGLLAFIWVTCGWVPRLRRAFAGVSRLASPQERAIYYNAVFILVFFVFSGCFHPISTEWPEWIAFAVALGFFTEVSASRQKQQKRVFAIVRGNGPLQVPMYDRN